MKQLACWTFLALFSISAGAQVPKGEEKVPVLARTIALANVRGVRPNTSASGRSTTVPGRIDHGAYDPVTDRLFVAALENCSMEVLDLKTGRRVMSVTNLSHPQGIAIVPSVGCAVTACGGDGTIHVFDTKSLREVKSLFVGDDADNVRYNASNNTVLVSYGSTNSGAIAVVDPQTWTVSREFRFSSRPESFQLDLAGERLFANLPRGVRATNDGDVAVISLRDGKTLAQIHLNGRARNFPMAFDAANQRLFVASRRPARLIEIDTKVYQVSREVICGEDSDDLFYDAKRNEVLVVAGGYRPEMRETNYVSQVRSTSEIGTLDVFSVAADGSLNLTKDVPTMHHARTGLFVPSRDSVYLFVPFRNDREAQVMEYRFPN